MSSSTETLIEALRILARDIVSEDGVANAAIAEAAERMEVLREALSGYYHQHRCGCGHPACNRCAEDQFVREALAEVEADRPAPAAQESGQ